MKEDDFGEDFAKDVYYEMLKSCPIDIYNQYPKEFKKFFKVNWKKINNGDTLIFVYKTKDNINELVKARVLDKKTKVIGDLEPRYLDVPSFISNNFTYIYKLKCFNLGYNTEHYLAELICAKKSLTEENITKFVKKINRKDFLIQPFSISTE